MCGKKYEVKLTFYSYKIFDVSPWRFDCFFCTTFSYNFRRKCLIAHLDQFSLPSILSHYVNLALLFFFNVISAAIVCNCSNTLLFRSFSIFRSVLVQGMIWSYDGDSCLGIFYIFAHNTNLHVASQDAYCSDLLPWSGTRQIDSVSLLFLSIRTIKYLVKRQGWDLKQLPRCLSGFSFQAP